MNYLGVILGSVFVLALLAIYFLYITRPKKKPLSTGNTKLITREETVQKWAEVSAMMSQGGPANFKISIMEADKLVDSVLKGKVSGETMADRLKNAKNLFTKDTYDKLWTAHKIRNKVAHEADFEALSSDAHLAVSNFEKALQELKAL